MNKAQAPQHTILTARFPLEIFLEIQEYAQRSGCTKSEIIIAGAMQELRKRKKAAQSDNTDEAVLTT